MTDDPLGIRGRGPNDEINNDVEKKEPQSLIVTIGKIFGCLILGFFTLIGLLLLTCGVVAAVH